ncbi:hypothetical protein T4A_6055 [Trichinella pseudospiralis]|uniref:Uncharacterized protein n=1 Tax=Trichinella pseudospiralis TaxID=6337 RepID=A0A0V1EG16_TRIPS|nr:hypothetical protein T4A_6055 [Trichinella pseudospiralis]
MIASSGKQYNCYYSKDATNIYCFYCFWINNREKFCLLNVPKSSHSRTCLLENLCKFLLHCYSHANMASVSMIASLRCAVRVQRCFPCDEDHGMALKTALRFGYYFSFLQKKENIFNGDDTKQSAGVRSRRNEDRRCLRLLVGLNCVSVGEREKIVKYSASTNYN